MLEVCEDRALSRDHEMTSWKAQSDQQTSTAVEEFVHPAGDNPSWEYWEGAGEGQQLADNTQAAVTVRICYSEKRNLSSGIVHEGLEPLTEQVFQTADNIALAQLPVVEAYAMCYLVQRQKTTAVDTMMSNFDFVEGIWDPWGMGSSIEDVQRLHLGKDR